MTTTFDDLKTYMIPVSIVVLAFLIGVLFEKFAIKKLKSITAKTKWKGDDILIASLHGMVPLWFVLAACNSIIVTLEISPTVIEILQKSLQIIFVFTVTLFFARITAGIIKLYSQGESGILPSASILANIGRIVIFTVGFLVILQSLGITITPIITALGVGGLAVALALQDTLGNLFAGLQIIASREVQQGNYIKLDSGEEGYVVDITWRNTTIRALPNNIIVVPNAKLASAIIVNYYLPETELAVLVQVGVSYKSDLTKVEQVTIEVAKEVMKEVSGGVSEFEPFIRYHTFGDSSINFTVIMRAREFVDQYLIKHEFVKRLHKRYAHEGIEIPFPQRDLHITTQEK